MKKLIVIEKLLNSKLTPDYLKSVITVMYKGSLQSDPYQSGELYQVTHNAMDKSGWYHRWNGISQAGFEEGDVFLVLGYNRASNSVSCRNVSKDREQDVPAFVFDGIVEKIE